MRTALRTLIVAFFPLLGTVADAEILHRVSAEEYIHDVKLADGSVWFASDSGAYRITGDVRTTVLENIAATVIAEVDGEVWIGSERGIFRVDGEKAVPILTDSVAGNYVTSILQLPTTTLVGTMNGLFRSDGSPLNEPLARSSINAIRLINNRIWVATTTNAFRLTGLEDEPAAVFPADREVADIIPAGGSVWLTTRVQTWGRYGPCFQLINGFTSSPKAYLAGHDVISVAEIDRSVWFATESGVYKLENGNAVRSYFFGSEAINTIAEIEGKIWLGGTQRLYRQRSGSGEPFSQFPKFAKGLDVKGILEIQRQIWVWTGKGAFRLDGDINIKPRLSTHSFFNIEISFGKVVSVKDVHYERNGRYAYGDFGTEEFSALLESNRDNFDKGVSSGRFAPVYSLERSFPVRPRNLFLEDLLLVVRDNYGNASEFVDRKVFILPAYLGVILIPLASVFAWWLFVLSMFALTPWWQPSMDLLQKLPSKLSPVTAIRILLIFQTSRRYVLKGYARRLRNTLLGPPTEVSDRDSKILVLLLDKQRVLLVGPRQLTEACVKSLRQAIVRHPESLKEAIPINLSLDLYRTEKEIQAGLMFEIKWYSGIQDEDLARYLFEKGNFALLLGPMDELQEDEQREVLRFINDHRYKNYIVLTSSSEAVTENDSWEIISLKEG